jgi:hypothetical protein
MDERCIIEANQFVWPAEKIANQNAPMHYTGLTVATLTASLRGKKTKLRSASNMATVDCR